VASVKTDERYGTATSAKLRKVDAAQARHARAVSDTEQRRAELGALLLDLLENEGVTRRQLAERYDCTSQTIANLAYGRMPRSRNGSH
jgi:hypothetical protein